MKESPKFKIRFTKEVTFEDLSGAVRKIYHVGDEEEVTCPTGYYFDTVWGGIWHNEAEVIRPEEI
jgi:hypothetical protein